MNRLALVLSGGSVRAAAQVGVLKALEEYNLQPNFIVGTSGGSIVGALYACGMSGRQIEQIFLSFQNRQGAIVDINWPGLLEGIIHKDPKKLTGFLQGEALTRIVDNTLPSISTFQELSKMIKRSDRYSLLFIPAVNLSDGKQTVFCDRAILRVSLTGNEYLNFRIREDLSISQAVRASTSIPGVFVPAQFQGEYFVDGGVRNGYPLSVAIKLARAKEVIGVNLGYAGMRRDNVAKQGMPEILSQSLDIMMRGQYRDALNDIQIAKSKIITINPLIYDVGTFELKYIPQMIERGYQVAKTLCVQKRLIKDGDRNENRCRLFADVNGPMTFPESRTAYFQQLLKDQIKEKEDEGSTSTSLPNPLRYIWPYLKAIGYGAVVTLVLASVGLFLWVSSQSGWVLSTSVVGTALVFGYFFVRVGWRLIRPRKEN